MKLSTLFAKFLYQNKQLRLPGIGVFSIDPSLTVPDITDKAFPEFLQNIRYTQQPVNAPDEDFINFIRTETGKIKPLAESDLDSFLSDGKILLNIGKPFHIDGIGYLQKNKDGGYDFKSGEPILQRLETYNHESDTHDSKERRFYLDSNPQNNSIRKILIALGAIAGIALVIWLGYILYDRNTSPAPVNGSDSANVVPHDTSRANKILDSAQRIIDDSRPATGNYTAGPGSYKFIIERTTNKGRAFRRFNQLKQNLAGIKMESPDSTLFKLYFVLPALPSDTARIKDSLRIWYGRKQIYVEK